MTEPLPQPIRAGPSLRRGTGPLFCAVPGVAHRGAAHHAAAARAPCSALLQRAARAASRPARRLRAVAGRSLILLPAIRIRRHRHSNMASYVSGVACSQSWSMAIRYRPLSDRHDRGAGLYSAGRGFAPPGSTKPADAVFALRVTIPVACARSRSLRATLAGAGFKTAPGSRTWPGRFAPFARPLSDPPSRASRRGASHRRHSFPCSAFPSKASASCPARRSRAVAAPSTSSPILIRIERRRRLALLRTAHRRLPLGAPRPRSLGRHPPLIFPPVSL